MSQHPSRKGTSDLHYRMAYLVERDEGLSGVPMIGHGAVDRAHGTGLH